MNIIVLLINLQDWLKKVKTNTFVFYSFFERFYWFFMERKIYREENTKEIPFMCLFPSHVAAKAGAEQI